MDCLKAEESRFRGPGGSMFFNQLRRASMIMALLSAGAAGGTTKNVMGKDPLKRPSDAVQLVGIKDT